MGSSWYSVTSSGQMDLRLQVISLRTDRDRECEIWRLRLWRMTRGKGDACSCSWNRTYLWLRRVWLWPSALHIHRKMIPKLLGNPVGIDLLGLQLFSTFLQKSSYFSFEIATKNVNQSKAFDWGLCSDTWSFSITCALSPRSRPSSLVFSYNHFNAWNRCGIYISISYHSWMGKGQISADYLPLGFDLACRRAWVQTCKAISPIKVT